MPSDRRTSDELEEARQKIAALEAELAARDVSAPNRMLEVLRRQARMNDAMFDQATTSFALLDRDFRFVRVTEAWAASFRMKVEQFAGRSFFDLFAPDSPHAAEVLGSLRDVVSEKKPLRFSARAFVLAEQPERGTTYWDWGLQPILDEHGDVDSLFFAAIDVTERKRAEDRIRLTEAEFNESQRVAQIGSWSWDADTDTITWSPEYFRIYNLDPTQPTPNYLDHLKVYAPESAQRLDAAVAKAMKTGEPYAVELELAEPDENRQWILARGEAKRDSAGRIRGLRGTAQNITDRKRAEEALRGSEARYHAIIDQAADGIFILDLQGQILEVNAAFARSHGYTIDELLALGLEGIDVEGVDPVPERMKRLLAGGSLTFEVEHRRKDGSHFPLEVTATVVDYADTKCIMAFHRDITDRKRAEEALRESEKSLAEAQRQTHVGSFEYDFTTGRLRWSEEMFRILDVSQEEFRGTPEDFLRRVHPADLSIVERTREQGLVPGVGTLALELRIQGPDASTRYGQMLFDTSFDTNGMPLRRMGTFQDITERKLAEEEKLKLEAQLRQAQKMESVGRLAGGVAHDFNNMLCVILGHVEMAMAQVDPAEPLHADLGQIKSAAERSANLTRQLLGFARKQVVAPQLLDLNETVASMLKMLRRLIGEDIDLVWLPVNNLWPVRVDPCQIDQILANLCVNARDAIGGVGRLSIETGNTTLDKDYCLAHAGAVPGEYVRLAVSDDGCGMDKATQGKLFEPFFTTKAVGQGTGLGLATVYGIVKQNHGFIDVDTELDQGTTFTIYLPRHVAKTEQARSESPTGPVVRGHETVLVVEDEPAILRMTTTMLEQQGYTVLGASTPGEAIRVARERGGDIHLLVADVVMPEMNGRDLAKNLVSIYPGIKRLFMSGYTADVIAHHGVLDEGVYFLQKPFSTQELASKVRAALDHE